jgi:hypothetical protein
LGIWKKLTRRQQRILIKLFGGGSSQGDGLIETVNLMRLGLITENGLTSEGQSYSLLLSKRNETRIVWNRYPRDRTRRVLPPPQRPADVESISDAILAVPAPHHPAVQSPLGQEKIGLAALALGGSRSIGLWIT